MGILDSIIADLNGIDTSQYTSMSGGAQTALSLNAYGTAADVFGAGMGAASHIAFGIQARQAAAFQAGQLRQEGMTARATAGRAAYDVDMNTQFVTSRALAVAAASGGGANDPTVVNLIARDAGRGAYLKALALYHGDDQNRMLQMEAEAKEYEGKATERNAMMVGASQTVRGAANYLSGTARGQSLFERFGGGMPGSGVQTDTQTPSVYGGAF